MIKRVHCTGDSNLAYFIYKTFKNTFRIAPNENIINELLITCLKRGDIKLVFKIFYELINDQNDIKFLKNKNILLKFYDICCIKHSIIYGDLLTKHLIKNNKKLNIDLSFILNNYLKICGVTGDLYKALNAIKQFDDEIINLFSINLLLRTLNTNGQIHDNTNKYQWNNVLSKNHHRNNINKNNEDKIKWNEIINPSLEIILKYDRYLNNINHDKKLIINIFDKFAFFASRFETNTNNFLLIYKYISSFKSYKLLYNSSIVGHLLRGFQKNKLYTESINLWKIYQQNEEKITNDNDNNEICHPYIAMIRICSYNLSRNEFRNLGKSICFQLLNNKFFNNQLLFDAVINFWSGNDETTIKFIENQIDKNNEFNVTNNATFCALIRCCTKNNNLDKSLFYIENAMKNINKINIDKIDIDKFENLLRIIFESYFNFGLYSESLILFKNCIYKYKFNKYLIKNGLFCLIKTFIENKKYQSILDLLLSEESDIYQFIFIENTLISNNDITLLMYCCYKINNLNLALFLFEISMKKNLTKYTIITYNYFIKLLINKYGQFSDIVINTILQFINENIFNISSNIINIYEIDKDIIPILIYCFLMDKKQKNENNFKFNIVCYPNLLNSKRFKKDNYRLLSGEDNDYLLSNTYYFLQNNYYNKLDCKWKFGFDEIECNFCCKSD